MGTRKPKGVVVRCAQSGMECGGSGAGTHPEEQRSRRRASIVKGRVLAGWSNGQSAGTLP